MVNAGGGDVRVHDDDVPERFDFLSLQVGHDLAVLVEGVFACALVVDHPGFLPGLFVDQRDADVLGLNTVRRGAVVGEVEAVVPLQRHGVALRLGVGFDAGTDAVEGVLQRALALGVPIGSAGGGHHPFVNVEILHAPLLGVCQRLRGAARVGQDQVIVLGNAVEHGPGGTGGADGVHGVDVGKQRQTAHHAVHVDVALDQHVRLHHAHMGNVVRQIAHGVGKNTAGEGRVQNFAVQGVDINLRFRGRHGGRFRRGFRGGFGGRRGGGLRRRRGGRGRRAPGTAAAQQQRQGKRQGNNSFHNLLPFLLVDIFPQICGLSQLNCVATLLLSMVLPSV